MSKLVQFDFEGAAVRTLARDDAPWFVLADVCGVLQIGNPSDAARRLDDDEKGVDSIDTLGGPQQTTIISESGLYSLILTSRKPEAKRFKKWITAEVLPAIRRTGRYQGPVSTLETETTTITPGVPVPNSKVVVWFQDQARLKQDLDSYSLGEAAQLMDWSLETITSALLDCGWIYRTNCPPYYLANRWAERMGHMTHEVTTSLVGPTKQRVAVQVRLTVRGCIQLLKRYLGT